MKLSVPFILASGSPRRSHLLTVVGFHFDVIPADIDETLIPGEPATVMVERLSVAKADAISSLFPDALVLGADTCVVLDDEILGKPTTPEEAFSMLKRLSGRQHTVHTGIALCHAASNRFCNEIETTTVEFAPLSDAEILEYVQTGSPMDKAGSYGIQDDGGAFFVRRIEGDFYTVVGLPLHRLYTVLQTKFSDIIDHKPASGTQF